jgi:TolB-like protein/DNA-binding winged helix-turn-helix (wHTH) protein/Flp pilus assembly protein TadD
VIDEKGGEIYRFGDFALDFSERTLYRGGKLVPLTPKSFDTLAVLVERQGKVVTKAELLRLIWPDSFVEENNLTQNISALRKVFENNYIETVPRRGYRFSAPVEPATETKPSPASEPLPAAAHRRTPRTLWIWVLAILAVGTALFAVARVRNPTPGPRVDSLVVLPFLNITGEPEDEYFSDGLTEELTNALAQIEGLRVVARTTAFQFREKPQDVRSIARQLNVAAVLEGSVRRQKEKLRVTVQLIDARSGYHIWSQTYDREEGELFGIQQEISAGVAQLMRPPGSPVGPGSSPAMRDRGTYNLYLLGRYHMNKPDVASVKKAMTFFEQAVEKDSTYAAAYAGLAETYLRLAQYHAIPSIEAWGAAQKYGARAISLDENLAEAHTTLGISHLILDWNWEAAEQRLRRALALNANEANARHWFSHYYTVFGRTADSLRESLEAEKLSPLDTRISGHLVFHYVRARDFPGAIRAGLAAVKRDPSNGLAYTFLTWAYECAAEWTKRSTPRRERTRRTQRRILFGRPFARRAPRAIGGSTAIFLRSRKGPTTSGWPYVTRGSAKRTKLLRIWSRPCGAGSRT